MSSFYSRGIVLCYAFLSVLSSSVLAQDDSLLHCFTTDSLRSVYTVSNIWGSVQAFGLVLVERGKNQPGICFANRVAERSDQIPGQIQC